MVERVTKLQPGSPYPLEIVWVHACEDPLALERELHTRFADYRVHGEWFERRGTLAFWLDLAADAVDRYLSSPMV